MIGLQLASAGQEQVPAPLMSGDDPCSESEMFLVKLLYCRIVSPKNFISSWRAAGVTVNVHLSHSRVLQDNDLRAVKRRSLEGLVLLEHL